MTDRAIAKNDIVLTLVPKRYLIPLRGRPGRMQWLPGGSRVVVESVVAGNIVIRVGNGTISFRPTQVRRVGSGRWGWVGGKLVWIENQEDDRSQTEAESC